MLLFHWILTLLLLVIFFYDLARNIIPNWLCGALLALYPVMLLTGPDLPEGFAFWHSLLVMLAVFGFGVFIFAMKWAGGGDVKLVTVLSLWAGTQVLADFLIITALLGGVLALALVLLRPAAAVYARTRDPEKLPRILRFGEPVPYGLAITSSFLLLLWLGQIPGLPVG